jgi:hypothetical protein
LLNSPHNNDNPQTTTTTARQAAEALFAPKQAHRPPLQQLESPIARKPRVLAALPTVSRTLASNEVPARRVGGGRKSYPVPTATEPLALSDMVRVAETPKPKGHHVIPKSQVARVRTWLRYGMTARQAADACGVSEPELKDALRSS